MHVFGIAYLSNMPYAVTQSQLPIFFITRLARKLGINLALNLISEKKVEGALP